MQVGDGAQNMKLERFFSRMDLYNLTPAIMSMSWPGRDISTRLAYNLESTYQLDLFKAAGWADGLAPTPQDQERTWGWAGHFASREWVLMRYQVITITPELFSDLKSGECSVYTMYYPLADTQPFSTTAEGFIYGMEGLEVSNFRLSASKPVPPGDTSKGTTPLGGSAASGEKLPGTTGPEKVSSTLATPTTTATAVTPAPAAVTSTPTVTTAAPAPVVGTTVTTTATPLTSSTTTSTVAVSKTAAPSPAEPKTVEVKPGEPPKVGSDKKKAAVDTDHKKSAEGT